MKASDFIWLLVVIVAAAAFLTLVELIIEAIS